MIFKKRLEQYKRAMGVCGEDEMIIEKANKVNK